MRRTLWITAALLLALAAVVIVDRRLSHEVVPPPPDPDWEAGPLLHLLPTVSHDRILIKVSFRDPLTAAPRLKAGDRVFQGRQTDTRGLFWAFDATGLAPATRYSLVIQSASGEDLCDAWPLTTFPAPDARPEQLRLLIYTGLGGHDVHISWRGTGPLPLPVRRRLLARALSFEPDALISSGDQIYYDLLYGKAPKYMGRSPESIAYAGRFDRSIPVLGTQNEEVLEKAVGPQIAYLYGTALRSVPAFFLLDDHDYFENDEAIAEDHYSLVDLLLGWRSPLIRAGISFPPDDFMLELGRTAQKLYLPEFLPDDTRPLDLPGSNAVDRAPGVSECYGTLRYGKLVEALLYESRRFITLTGDDAVFTHPEAERWLLDRMAAEETLHVVNVPAVVFGWSAGKWLEWYRDVRGEDGRLSTSLPKYMWQEGWFAQHNRLLQAASRMKRSVPLFVCGDIHSQAEGRILQSGELDLRANPVVAVASGSLGTGAQGFPSGGLRRIVPQPPADLTVEEGLSAVEKNGFVIVDFDLEKIVIRFFAWRPPDPVDAIDTLEPHHTLVLEPKPSVESQEVE
jgi:hypothetical protein